MTPCSVCTYLYENINPATGKVKKFCCRRCTNLGTPKIIEQLKKNSHASRARFYDSYNQNPNICEFCGSDIPIKPGRTPSETREKRFCDHSCAAKHQSRSRTKKVKPINPKSYENFISRWLAGQETGVNARAETKGQIRRWMIESRGEKCEQCGWGERHKVTGNVPIHLDHIDGNGLNCKLANLRLLCPNCHSLTETYGSLNRGKGRGSILKKLQQEVGANAGLAEK